MRSINYGKQKISQEDIDAVCACLEGEFLTQGPKVPELEQKIISYCKAGDALAVSSGTAALHCAYAALGVTRGDVVWVPPITFSATANAAVICGAVVDFIDVDPVTGNVTAVELEKKIREYKQASKVLPRVLTVVHMAGEPCQIHSIGEICAANGIKLVEDACHALGATYSEDLTKVGSNQFADATTFSLHPVKTITSGEGGIITFTDTKLAKTARTFASNGIDRQNHPDGHPWNAAQVAIGLNYRLSEIQASLALSQLAKIDLFIETRRKIAKAYKSGIHNSFFLHPSSNFDASSWHLYVLRVNKTNTTRNRNEFISILRSRGINSLVHYPPLYSHPFFYMPDGADRFPGAQEYADTALTIPLHASLSNEDVSYVIETINELE